MWPLVLQVQALVWLVVSKGDHEFGLSRALSKLSTFATLRRSHSAFQDQWIALA